MPKILMSACLLGQKVRYDGGIVCSTILYYNNGLKRETLSLFAPNLLEDCLFPERRPRFRIKNRALRY